MSTPIVEVSGAYREQGRQHGEALAPTIESILSEVLTKDTWDAAKVDWLLAHIVILGVFDQPWVQGISPLVANESTLLPTVGSPGVWPVTISLMQRGRIQAGPIISGKLPMSEYKGAFETVSRGGPKVLKCLLRPHG